MTASSLPPEQQASVKPFDPLVLDRSVIALPLLKKMQDDDRLVLEAGGRRPGFNAVIRFNPAFPDGVAGALAEVRKMAVEAADRAIASTGRGKGAAKGRDRELIAAVRDQLITEPVTGSPHGFARLHAAVIRRLLALNDRLSPERGPIAPILSIFPERFDIIIDLNLEYPGGRPAARKWVIAHIAAAKARAQVDDAGQGLHLEKDQLTSQYVFARLEADVIRALVELDMDAAEAVSEKRQGKKRTKSGPPAARHEPKNFRAIFRVWPDFEVSASITRSISAVKADAAQTSFSAKGAGITWAVMDSGIRKDHPHFKLHSNLEVPEPSWHKDFTPDGGDPFNDENGHGTHVAGIIAGEWRVAADAPPGTKRPVAVSRWRTRSEDIEYQETQLDGISGMAPRCKLVSLRVLDENGKGAVSNLIAAINHIQEINGHGRRLLIHGLNMSVGYNFEPEWFACGQSPLCVEVDRLVKTGVVVVVAAGNTGYGSLSSLQGTTAAGLPLTINDPGNADLAITVGSTHRDMPHIYGVSYFSSKGPTGDGRLKPDLVAPGEKITSCATGTLKSDGAKGRECDYVETSGTSMAAPHVSGVIAAFLSVRQEFIGKAERVKDIFVSSATDLRRDRYFQGAGLVDLMRAIQSV